MTITSTTLPNVHTMGRALRIVLATAAILVLITVAFAVGRVTVSSGPAPASGPATNASVSVPNDAATCQEAGHSLSC